MELRQLEYLVAVAEEGGFTRAAERVHISQSGVSAQVRQLEREVGTALIDRAGRRAAVTAAGAAALPHARQALAAVAALGRAVDEVRGVVRGRLAVGMVTGCTATPLFEALAAFHRAHPGVAVDLVEANSVDLVARVRAGELDLALVATAGAPPEGLGVRPIISEPIVAAVAPDHPLAGAARTTLAELCAHPLVCLPVGTGVRAALDRACAAGGLSPSVVLQASAPDAVADLAARGLGAAVLSASMTEGTGDRLAAVAIDGADVPAVLSLAWTPTVGPALRALLDDAEAAFGTGPASPAEAGP